MLDWPRAQARCLGFGSPHENQAVLLRTKAKPVGSSCDRNQTQHFVVKRHYPNDLKDHHRNAVLI